MYMFLLCVYCYTTAINLNLVFEFEYKIFFFNIFIFFENIPSDILSGEPADWKTTAVRRIAVRENGVSRHHRAPIVNPPEEPRTITALWH